MVIFSSKVFYVTYIIDTVYTRFYGTAMPTVDHEEQDLNVEVKISLNEFDDNLETVGSNQNGDWKYGYNNYANRGEYIFTFKEISDDPAYESRGKKTFKCIGSDRGMNCIDQN